MKHIVRKNSSPVAYTPEHISYVKNLRKRNAMITLSRVYVVRNKDSAFALAFKYSIYVFDDVETGLEVQWAYTPEHISYVKNLRKRNAMITLSRVGLLLIFLLLWERVWKSNAEKGSSSNII